ncbi:MAG: DNA-3-methyladenine glycosylase family protein [Actinomycetota bacterium]
MFEASGSIVPVPPFDFAKSLRFLQGFSPTEGEQAIAAGAVRKATRIGGRTLLFEVRSEPAATVDGPRLAYRLWSERTIDGGPAVERIGRFLSVDDDVTAFYDRAGADPVLATHVDRLYGLHQVRFLTPFENACWAVMGQRAPVAVARRAKDAFVERYGGSIEVDGMTHRAFPEAADVAGMTADDLRPLVRNDRRATYLANVIEAWQTADEPWLETGPYDDVNAWLRSIKGFGEWSTLFVLFRGLGRGDRMILTRPNVEAMRSAYGDRPDAELQSILDAYGPWGGYALLYLRASG